MNAETYRERRSVLREAVPDGDILILGNDYAARNYADNVYPFRQDSSFLYYAGVHRPDLALVIGSDGRSTLFGPRADSDDLVWFGPRSGLDELAEKVGCDGRGTRQELASRLAGAGKDGSRVHFLPPYRGDRTLKLADLLGVATDAVAPRRGARAFQLSRYAAAHWRRTRRAHRFGRRAA